MASPSNDAATRQLGCIYLALIIIAIFSVGFCCGFSTDVINDWLS